jgi:CheY-like chemotaxis protein
MARILVIDDKYEVRAVVERMLQSAGHEVVQAGGGREGVEKYRADPTDLIIIDLYMPELDGFETILVLRREFPDVKIIAMSGNTAASAMLTVAQRLGSVAVLEKPFTMQQLLEAVERVA